MNRYCKFTCHASPLISYMLNCNFLITIYVCLIYSVVYVSNLFALDFVMIFISVTFAEKMPVVFVRILFYLGIIYQQINYYITIHFYTHTYLASLCFCALSFFSFRSENTTDIALLYVAFDLDCDIRRRIPAQALFFLFSP